jgi:hypothetical protein
MDVEYSHEQFSPFALGIPGGLGLLMCIALVAGGAPTIALVVAAFCLLLVLTFFRLRVEVRHRELRIRFGLGLVHRTFPLSELVDARPVRNKWYYGWGIRWTPYGWLFNVYGLDAVQIELRSGKQYRIGTNEPGRLSAALQRAMAG